MAKPITWILMAWVFCLMAIFYPTNQTTYQILCVVSLAVCSLLIKLNQIATRFENAQRLQNIAAKTLKPTRQGGPN